MTPWKRPANHTFYMHFEGSMEVDTHRFPPGKSGLEFAKGLLRGMIIVEDCGGYLQLPPRGFCEGLEKPLGYKELSNDIIWTVEAYTVLDDGSVWVYVTPDEEDVIGGLIHRLKPDGEVYIGMPVRPVFKPEDKRKGTIDDILYFEQY